MTACSVQFVCFFIMINEVYPSLIVLSNDVTRLARGRSENVWPKFMLRHLVGACVANLSAWSLK